MPAPVTMATRIWSTSARGPAASRDRRRGRPGPHSANREREIVALVAQGLSNHDIADTFVISHATTKTHVSRAMTKLGARDRAQLVALAYQHRLVQLPDR
jgi:DNA-binding NarL/FixJ family response regulator